MAPQGAVFISYFREDSPRVDRLERDLCAAGLDVWLDRSSLQGGEVWKTVVEKEIWTARAMVICLSSRGLERESEVHDELRLGVQRYRRMPPGAIFLIPVRLDEVRMDLLRRPIDGVKLADLNVIDLFPDERWTTGIAAIVASIKSPAPSPPPPVPAAEPAPSGLTARERAARVRYLADRKGAIEKELRDSLHHAPFVDLGLADTPSATRLSRTYRADNSLEFTRIEDALAHYKSRLLILGVPGAGKSTTLMHLALALIEEAQRDEKSPVPVLVNLARFQVEAEGHRRTPPWWYEDERTGASGDRRFERWLADALPVPRFSRKWARRWLREGRAAVLLDGLDEVRDNRRAALARHLNRTFLRHHPDVPVVICSRVDEYRPLEGHDETRLRLDGAVTLTSFSVEQVLAYVTAAGAEGLRQALSEALREAPHGNPELVEFARTPINLSLMTLAYADLEPGTLDGARFGVDRWHHLMETYVARMLQRKERRKRGLRLDGNPAHEVEIRDYPYSPDRVDRCLDWLALRMSVRMETECSISGFYDFINLPRVDGRPSADAWAIKTIASLAFVACGLMVAAAIMPWTTEGALLTVLLVGVGAVAYGRGDLSKRWSEASGPLQVGAFFLLVLAVPGVAIRAGAELLERMVTPATLGVLAGAVPSILIAGAITFAAGLLAWQIVDGRRERPQFETFFIPVLATIGLPLSAFVSLAWVELMSGPLVLTMFIISVISTNRKSEEITVMSVLGGGAAAGGAIAGIHGAIVCLATLWYALFLGNIIGAEAHRADRRGVIGSLNSRADATRKLLLRLVLSPSLLLLFQARGELPFNLRKLSRDCHAALLLKKPSENLEFVHRLLRDYFAQRTLIPKVRSSEREERLQAIRDMGYQGVSAVETLAKLASDRDIEIGEAAIVALGHIPAKAAIGIVAEASRYPEARLRRAAALSAVHLPRPDAERIVASVSKDADVDVRIAAIELSIALSSYRDTHSPRTRPLEETVAAVFSTHTDGHVPVMRALLTLLPRTFGDRWHAELFGLRLSDVISTQGEALRTLLADTERDVRVGALDLVGGHRSISNAKALIERLRDEQRHEIRAHVAAFLCDWLSGGGDDAFIKLIEDGLLQALSDPSPDVLRSVAFTLVGRVLDPSVLDVIRSLSTDRDSAVRARCARALGDHGSVEDENLLVRLINDTDADVRRAAAVSVGKIRGPHGLEVLVSVAADPESRVRAQVAVALGAFGEAALAPLDRLTADREEPVRRAATQAKLRIGRKV